MFLENTHSSVGHLCVCVFIIADNELQSKTSGRKRADCHPRCKNFNLRSSQTQSDYKAYSVDTLSSRTSLSLSGLQRLELLPDRVHPGHQFITVVDTCRQTTIHASIHRYRQFRVTKMNSLTSLDCGTELEHPSHRKAPAVVRL